MPKIRYETPKWLDKWFEVSADSEKLDVELIPTAIKPKMAKIMQAIVILEEYQEKGFNLTLRQLYYQFVSRGLIPNTDQNYKVLGSAVSDGRLWGFIDWNHLEDRGRNFLTRAHWDTPADIIEGAAHSFSVDYWEGEDYRIEVWVEKQALESIVARACRPYDVGYLACKGYMSQSEMWVAAQRLKGYETLGQVTTILHLGDHDPSGIDMSRDIQDRLWNFGAKTKVDRIALNMDQINQYHPPPNPAKVTDSRAQEYIRRWGRSSWELDALNPEQMTALIEGEIRPRIGRAYPKNFQREQDGQKLLHIVADNWSEIAHQYGD